MNILKRIFFGFKISDTRKYFPTQDEYCISYHDPRSITWSWALYWIPPWRVKNTKIKHKLVGLFFFRKQEKMWKDEYKL